MNKRTEPPGGENDRDHVPPPKICDPPVPPTGRRVRIILSARPPGCPVPWPPEGYPDAILLLGSRRRPDQTAPTVQLYQGSDLLLTFRLQAAVVLTHLAHAKEGRMRWKDIAPQLWPEEGLDPVVVLRRRYDQLLRRVRNKLGSVGVRRTLLRAGSGQLTLELLGGDKFMMLDRVDS